MKKRFMAAFVLVALVLSLGISSASARWDSSWICDDDFSISGTTASCYLKVTADRTSRITGSVQIVRINSDGSRTGVKAWNNLSGTGSLVLDETYTSSLLAPSATYRMYYSVTVAGVDSISDYVEVRK